ncbi:MAG TPA: TadE family protein [Acidimicrobiia bacterium]|nr:TadE family protein [Acidimicrobiia bacterium]
MRHERGATLIETALVAPLLFLLIFGLVEFGRYIAMTSTVTNASREATRYASGTGTGSGTEPRYADCDGMRDAAQQFGVIGQPNDGQITLEYDEGPGTAVFLTCSGSSVAASSIETGDRIVATVSVPYQPVAPLVGQFLGPITITVQTIRTINKG